MKKTITNQIVGHYPDHLNYHDHHDDHHLSGRHDDYVVDKRQRNDNPKHKRNDHQ